MSQESVTSTASDVQEVAPLEYPKAPIRADLDFVVKYQLSQKQFSTAHYQEHDILNIDVGRLVWLAENGHLPKQDDPETLATTFMYTRPVKDKDVAKYWQKYAERMKAEKDLEIRNLKKELAAAKRGSDESGKEKRKRKATTA